MSLYGRLELAHRKVSFQEIHTVCHSNRRSNQRTRGKRRSHRRGCSSGDPVVLRPTHSCRCPSSRPDRPFVDEDEGLSGFPSKDGSVSPSPSRKGRPSFDSDIRAASFETIRTLCDSGSSMIRGTEWKPRCRWNRKEAFRTSSRGKMRDRSGATRAIERFGEGKCASLSLAATLALSLAALDPSGSMIRSYGISALLSAACGTMGIPLLKALEAGQVVREEGPKAHLSKTGTPTMGGCFFVPTGAFTACFLSGFSSDVVAISIATLFYAIVGLLDDVVILIRRNNRGISPRTKFGLQLTVGITYLVWLAFQNVLPSFDVLPLVKKMSVRIGLLFWPLALFTLTAESNGINLTDGLDGLAAGTSAAAFSGMGIAVLEQGYGSIAIFCACMAGACIGFLAHNTHKARIFMGDTGSLALGGGLALVGVRTNMLLVLFITSFLFALESLSVVAQVSYFKFTKKQTGEGKRIFKMAPFHHHLELGGWPAPSKGLSESRVVSIFYMASVLLACLGILNGRCL